MNSSEPMAPMTKAPFIKKSPPSELCTKHELHTWYLEHSGHMPTNWKDRPEISVTHDPKLHNTYHKPAESWAQPHHRRALEALQHEATSIAGDIAVKGVVNEETERREALRSVMIKMPETRTGQIAFLLQKLPVDEFMSIAEGMGCKWEKLLIWAKAEAPIK